MKDTFYFSHDSNASDDPKIKQLLAVYGYEGYGWFWRIIELMRSQEHYDLTLKGKYAYDGLAETLRTSPEKAEKFICDCTTEFELFCNNDGKIYSNSLNKRMQYYDNSKMLKSQQGKYAAETRWNNARALHEQSMSNADAMQNDAKESKRNESKRNKRRNIKEEKLGSIFSIETYKVDLSKEFPELNIDQEIKSCETWWSESKKSMSRPKSAYRNWMIKAQEIRSNGKHQSYTTENQGQSPANRTGKYKHLFES